MICALEINLESQACQYTKQSPTKLDGPYINSWAMEATCSKRLMIPTLDISVSTLFVSHDGTDNGFLKKRLFMKLLILTRGML